MNRVSAFQKLFFRFLLVSFLIGPKAFSESFELTLKDPPAAIQVGDLLWVQIRGASHPSSVVYEPKPEPTPTSSSVPKPTPKTLHEMGFSDPSIEEVDGEAFIKLIVVKEGSLELPPLTVRGEKEALLGETLPLKVEVSSAISPQDPKPTEKEQLEPAIGLPFPIVWMILLSLVFLLLMATLGWLWKKRRRKKFKNGRAPVSIPEDEEGLIAIEALEKQGYLESGQFKLYYFRLSEILKTYVGRRYAFNALESTTDEIMRSLKRADSDSGSAVHPLFENLDLVKFTDTVPTIEESQELTQFIKDWIEKTRRRFVIQEKDQVNAS